MANITNLPVNGTLKTGGEKVIALNQQNIDFLKKGYINDPSIKASVSAVSNKDLLTQSFTAPTLENSMEAPVLEVVPPVVEVAQSATEAAPLAETIVANNEMSTEAPIQLTGIPAVQNTTNLESSPANMSMEVAPSIEEDTMDPLIGVDSLIPNTDLSVMPLSAETDLTAPVVDSSVVVPVNDVGTTAVDISGPEVKAEEPNLESPFQVTAAPNIFDQPIAEPTNEVVSGPSVEPGSVPAIDLGIATTVEPTNGTVENPVEPTLENAVSVDPLNIFAVPQQPSEEVVTTTPSAVEEPQKNIEIGKKELSNDILQVEIALEKEAADLYDKLAQNTRKKIELLEQKKKTTNNTSEMKNISEPSASDLFNINGTLDDNKVLEESTADVLKLVA